MKNRFAFLTSLFIAMMIITAGAAQEQKPNQPVAPRPAAEAEATDEPVAITEKTKRVETQVQAVLTPDQFANFRPPFINDKGEIALLGLISDPASPNRVGQKMFVRGVDGKWRLLLDQGEKSVDTSIVIDTFGLPHVNASGEVTFLANGPKIADNLPVTSDPNDPASFRPLVSNQVLYKKTKDGIRSIYRMGVEVPNMPSYITGISNVTSNNVGTTAFIGTYSEPDGRGLFFVADGKVSLIARSGQKIGKNETGTFSEHYYPSSINDRNEVAFLGRSGDKSGIFIGSPRGVEIIAFGGRPTPLKGANFLGFGNRTPAINNRGDVLFVGFFDGPQAGRGLFLKPVDGPIRLIARSGDAITGTNWNLTDFSSITLSDNGDIAFSATYAGRSRGIFIKTAKGIEPVAILDQRIPGGDKDEVFNHFTQPDINSRGEVVFYAQWRTPKTGVNIGVFWRDAQGALKMLFKRGDQMPK